ncbi:hypothetical protein GE253_13630 [Niveispirillum sp. SYP-B3756]|nr:hypothetical protein [Niveispirillum sp. SYP-B3756]
MVEAGKRQPDGRAGGDGGGGRGTACRAAVTPAWPPSRARDCALSSRGDSWAGSPPASRCTSSAASSRTGRSSGGRSATSSSSSDQGR